MPIRLSQVKSLCTSSELALVQASRRPELDKLTPARLKQYAQRARKLFDKWQDQSRSQARGRRREAGFTEDQTRADLKARIFQEALQKFEQRLGKLEGAGAAPAGKPAAKPKKVRAREHREARAGVRAELAETEAELNIQAASEPTSAEPPATDPRPSPSAGSPSAQPAEDDAQAAPPPVPPAAATTPEQASMRPADLPGKKQGRPAPPPVATKGGADKAKQREATTAAKQARVTTSGLKSRVRGHVSARGRRSQTGRDRKS